MSAISHEHLRQDDQQELGYEFAAVVERFEDGWIVVIVWVEDLDDEFGVDAVTALQVLLALSLDGLGECLAEIQDRDVLYCLRVASEGVDEAPTHPVDHVYRPQGLLLLEVLAKFPRNLLPVLLDRLLLVAAFDFLLDKLGEKPASGLFH